MLNPLITDRRHLTRIDEYAAERQMAQRMFQQMFNRGWMGQMRSRLTRKSRALNALATVRGAARGGQYRGVQVVHINQIKGSEGRTADFDIDFNPRHEHMETRWVNVAIAYLRGISLPPVELIKVGNEYYVRDGHHRVSIARALQQCQIEAVVTEMLSC